MRRRTPRKFLPQYRFGIGEWYGQSFIRLSPEERRRFAEIQFIDTGWIPDCPFLSTPYKGVQCWKRGGVCSLRSYERSRETGEVRLDQRESGLRTTCPSRFEESRLIYPWISEVILGSSSAVPVGQVNFLERVSSLATPPNEEVEPEEEVGRIDNVLIIPGSSPLTWCPVEIQAVYFSGDKMEYDFRAILEHQGDTFPFPEGSRRPDYRSSAPKRLMPQLQIKVPELRRWGKKMAVVIDESFFKAMGPMSTVRDVSNCDVVWFIVRYEERSGVPRLTRGEQVFTTLESSVTGLIAGRPVTQAQFERRIQAKLAALSAVPSRG